MPSASLSGDRARSRKGYPGLPGRQHPPQSQGTEAESVPPPPGSSGWGRHRQRSSLTHRPFNRFPIRRSPHGYVPDAPCARAGGRSPRLGDQHPNTRLRLIEPLSRTTRSRSGHLPGLPSTPACTPRPGCVIVCSARQSLIFLTGVAPGQDPLTLASQLPVCTNHENSHALTPRFVP